MSRTMDGGSYSGLSVSSSSSSSSRLSPSSRKARREALQAEEDEKRILLLEQQLAHIRWKKMQNTREIQTMMNKSAEMHKVDQLDSMSRDRIEERAQWMQAIIQDELQRPLHVDKNEKFPMPYEVEEGVRREMQRIHAHEQSVVSMERALREKEALRVSKLLKQEQDERRSLQRQRQQEERIKKTRAQYSRRKGQGNSATATKNKNKNKNKNKTKNLGSGSQARGASGRQKQQQRATTTPQTSTSTATRSTTSTTTRGKGGPARSNLPAAVLAPDPRRREHLVRLAAIRKDLERHRKQKEREVLTLVRIQRDAPLSPAVHHSVDQPRSSNNSSSSSYERQ